MAQPICSRRSLLGRGTAALTASLLFGRAAGAQEDPQAPDAELADLVEAAALPLPPIAEPGFAHFIDRYAGAKVVLLGEASHGTDEFYRARTAITERLVREHGFTVVAVEADWPDAGRVDAYIRSLEALPSPDAPFPRFPSWMWRNHAVEDLMTRLRAFNEEVEDPAREVGFYGLDLYSLPSSMDAVEEFALRHDPATLEEVRAHYGCLAPWAEEPESYGALVRGPAADTCAADVSSVVEEVLNTRLGEIEIYDRVHFDAVMNAHVVAASEAYYRAMYEGSVASWNLRDTQVFETLQRVLNAHGRGTKAVVWAHNSHISDARATGMGATSAPGRPVSTILETRTGNPIVMVDEFEKASVHHSHKGGVTTSAHHALLSLLEPASARLWSCPILRRPASDGLHFLALGPQRRPSAAGAAALAGARCRRPRALSA